MRRLLDRSRSWTASPALLLLAAAGAATHAAAQQLSPPYLDLSSLGEVSLTGDFDAVAVYKEIGQTQGPSNNGSVAILSHPDDGTYDSLAYTDASIAAMCSFVLKDGTDQGLVVAGNFTSIGGIPARSVALYNSTLDQFVALPGIEGTVSALLCDNATNTVYVGGLFDASNSSNAIALNASGDWVDLPFAGFDAQVYSITKGSDGHIIFGGSFTGVGTANESSETSNTTSRATQVINLSTANLTAGANTTSAGLITCPSNSTEPSSQPFLLANGSAGYWQADFGFGFEPSKLRLWNIDQDGSGTETWRFTAFPINGIMNFTYTDPDTGDETSCSAECPLALSTAYQDFYFVNTVGMDSFRIDILAWYGDGAGLAGIELFQDDIFAYAIESFNEPNCTSSTVSSVTTTGDWYTVPSRSSVADYLAVVTGPTTLDTDEIVFEPNIQEEGNYTVIVYTPGCIQDSSCSARGSVNVSVTVTSDYAFSTMLAQTNDYDKYDEVYVGQVDAVSSTFRPKVAITPSGLETDQLIVASRVQFGYIASTGGLNGLFDYDPDDSSASLDFSDSLIDTTGNNLDSDAEVLALITNDDVVYAAGSFSDSSNNNILAFSDDEVVSLPGGGLNAPVVSMYSQGDFLYLGGSFNATYNGTTTGLRNAAAYQYSTKSWVALGAGLDGPVERVAPLLVNTSSTSQETMIAFSGSFEHIVATSSAEAVSVSGLAVWTPSAEEWLVRTSLAQQLLSGQVIAGTTLPNGTWLGAGTLSSLGQAISGAASMSTDSDGNVLLTSMGLDIGSSSQTTNSTTSVQKRSTTALEQQVSGVTIGAYYSEGSQNVSIFAGHFTASASNGSTIHNLLFLNSTDSDVVTGLPAGVDSNSTFFALTLQSTTLLAGGNVTGEINGQSVSGLVFYDMDAADFREIQPAPLVGDDVVVNAISIEPGTSGVYVGGSFESTSQGLSCPCVCMYDLDSSQWNAVGSGLDGTIVSLYWTDDTKLLAAGNLTLDGNATKLAQYSPKPQTWEAVSNVDIPGPITAYWPTTSDGSQFWIAGTAQNGSTYMMEVDGHTSRPVLDTFLDGSTIHGLQEVSLTKSHSSTASLDDNTAILVTGLLNLTDYGLSSAAVYNGSAAVPLILATKKDGSSGSLSKMVSSVVNSPSSSDHHHSRGIVVLVSLCAALGTIFLIILIGIILNRIQRRRAGYSAISNVPYADKPSNIARVPPERLFGHLAQGATAPTAPHV